MSAADLVLLFCHVRLLHQGAFLPLVMFLSSVSDHGGNLIFLDVQLLNDHNKPRDGNSGLHKYTEAHKNN